MSASRRPYSTTEAPVSGRRVMVARTACARDWRRTRQAVGVSERCTGRPPRCGPERRSGGGRTGGGRSLADDAQGDAGGSPGGAEPVPPRVSGRGAVIGARKDDGPTTTEVVAGPQ